MSAPRAWRLPGRSTPVKGTVPSAHPAPALGCHAAEIERSGARPVGQAQGGLKYEASHSAASVSGQHNPQHPAPLITPAWVLIAAAPLKQVQVTSKSSRWRRGAAAPPGHARHWCRSKSICDDQHGRHCPNASLVWCHSGPQHTNDPALGVNFDEGGWHSLPA